MTGLSKHLGLEPVTVGTDRFLFQAAPARSTRKPVLAHSGVVPAHSLAPHGRARPFLDLSPLIHQKPSFISSHLTG